jgi:F-type H+-transporting ATPase subunit b
MPTLYILASEGGGHAANSWLLPSDAKEWIISGIASLILFALLYKFAKKPVADAWNGRIERISEELSDAEKARAEAEEALADVQARIANADAERQRILAEAHQTAAAVKAQIEERAGTDAAEIRSRAVVDIEASKAQVSADLQAEVADLAVGAAEVVVSRNLDPATQQELIEKYIAQLATGAGVN